MKSLWNLILEAFLFADFCWKTQRGKGLIYYINTVLRRKKIIDFQQGYLFILIIHIIQNHIISGIQFYRR